MSVAFDCQYDDKIELGLTLTVFRCKRIYTPMECLLLLIPVILIEIVEVSLNGMKMRNALPNMSATHFA